MLKAGASTYIPCRSLFSLMRPGTPVALHAGDARTADVRDKQFLPDLATLSSQPRGCLDGADPIPADVSSLFIRDLWGFDFALVPEASALYAKLGVPKKPLTLIEPQFEAPTPPLLPSVFPPRMPEPPPPTLERFDLDDSFANEYFKVWGSTIVWLPFYESCSCSAHLCTPWYRFSLLRFVNDAMNIVQSESTKSSTWRGAQLPVPWCLYPAVV